MSVKTVNRQHIAKHSLIAAVLLMLCCTVRAQHTAGSLPFSAGERIYYDAYYNLAFIWLNAGKVVFSVDSHTGNGEAELKLGAIGTTQKGYDKLFKVRDTFEVFVNPLTLEPITYRQITVEGFYTAQHHYRFNRANRTVQMHIRRDSEPLEVKTIEWPHNYHDLLSMVYAARTINFTKYSVGDKIPIYMLIDGENFELYIRYKGEETITNRDGKRYRCLKFSPLLVEGTIFKKGEHMTVWVTSDSNRIPIVVEAEILIGSVKAYFTGAQGLKYPVSAGVQ